MTQAVVFAEELTKHYAQQAVLKGITLSIPRGVCLALLGHNGAGKTTLMKLMLGVTHPTGGRLQVLGNDPAHAPLSFRRQIGFLPENIAFYDEMTGADTLTYFARLKNETQERCGELLARVGLSDAANRRVKTYSKGMRQRLGLAQSLLGQPGLLLLDEPTTGLDPMLRQEFFRIIQEVRSGGGTVILSSHILTELEAHTDFVAIMSQGQLMAYGTLDELRRRVDLPVRLLLSVPEGRGRVEQHLVDLECRSFGLHTLEVICPVAEKMSTLRRIGQLEEVVDVEIHLPTLEDVYVHFGHINSSLEKSA
ncbi:MAG: ABC transporter ATP-binding protein [Magnetococcus sp. DMHC-6]